MSHSTVLHRIVRPGVSLIARTGVVPNQVTTLRLITGLGAALCFAAGTSGWQSVGALIFLLSILLDRADGELARQINQSSPFGHRYDLASDCIASVAAFVGLGIGLASDSSDITLWFGVLAGLGIGVLFAELNFLRFADVRSFDLAPGISFDPDDAMVLVPILIWLEFAYEMTIAAAIITPIAAVGLGLIALVQRRSAGRRPL